jgi:D-glycero-alpha-D-manno-heptose 1-phosphate guanylyltransferase
MKEAIILAGGKGTRLKSVTKGGQKVVVSVGKKSFIELLIEQLDKEGFDRVHLALGYRAEEVEKVVSGLNLSLEINTIQELVPLGTGGAIKNALAQVSASDVVVLNGDSINGVSYSEILANHKKSKADISVLTKFVTNIARYGEVITGLAGNITGFNEKTGLNSAGKINSGVYVLSGKLFDNYFPKIFSLEQFLADNVGNLNMLPITSDGSFIDIGTPEDYQKFIEQIED